MKPLIIAHRGASASEPENTLKAFQTAYKLGADGIELDIHLTKDGKIVVCHDNNIKRITGKPLKIAHSSLAQLRKLDFGKGEKIPTLDEVFDGFLKKFSIINVEVKSTGLSNHGVEEKLAKCLKKFKAHDKVLVSSFNPFNLLRVKNLVPNLRLGYLMCREQNVIARNRLWPSVLRPHSLNLDQNLYKYARHRTLFKTDYPKWIWTVNTLKDMRFWIARNDVEAIITNYPDKLRKLIEK
jgi:glycerophosphoryl diester phosphodiesterase